MNAKESSRREGLQTAATATGAETERQGVQSLTANITRSTQAAQSAHRPAYTQAEADRRKREARQRMKRTRQQKQAARYFCNMQGVVRRV